MAPTPLLTVEALDATVTPLKTLAPIHEEEVVQVKTEVVSCQICFDEFPVSDNVTVTKLCRAKCPAVVCSTCLQGHIRVSVTSAFAGVLPKVRCPICLVLMNKSRWQSLVEPSIHDTYVSACRLACSFQTPCCHNTEYTHLPRAYEEKLGEHEKRQELATLMLVPSLSAKLPRLRQLTKRFCNHKIASSALIRFIEDEFGAHITSEMRDLLMEHLLTRILDEERRATLMLAYLAKYTMIKTRCCEYNVCFNCKRNISSHENPGVCDESEISADCIVECRSCRVTMVKVEGCDSVKCWCGFWMDWSVELDLISWKKKNVVPIDVYDTEVCQRWLDQRRWINRVVYDELVPLRLAMRMSMIDQLLPPFKQCLRRMLQQYIWSRRFRQSVPQLLQDITTARMKWLAARLKKTKLQHHVCRWVWHFRWRKINTVISMRLFWSQYYEDRQDELQECVAEENAILTIGLH
ncbi:hypothetical protein Poli38472_007110 [Pythium oligandrum]|uniref:RING-type domain-containing protein n=1 Tax=Pythium oligandrum TaxID=41045 RepID=A0A8K1FD18_PYTOL|nr:hypothetical protein Poli38472_007110 [Pythium oligandrum]|eukprot:TMW58965.1 hypothetical protein Poli38472_007110 [Pythium oligandrum]